LEFLNNAIGMVTGNATVIAGGGTAAIILWVLKKVPNEQIKNIVGTFAEGIGTTVTLGLSKWKWTALYWNKTIEPWLIDLLDNTLGAFTEGLIKGLRSDNKDKK